MYANRVDHPTIDSSSDDLLVGEVTGYVRKRPLFAFMMMKAGKMFGYSRSGSGPPANDGWMNGRGSE